MQQAFHENHALQCGYCTPGMIMQSIDLLADNPDPSEEEVRARPGRQPLPLHRLPEHRQGGAVRRRARQPPMSPADAGAYVAMTDRQRSVRPARDRQGPRRRKEDGRLITGRTRWTDNIVLPGMLHLAMVRSPFAHARITAIDTDGGPGRRPESSP